MADQLPAFTNENEFRLEEYKSVVARIAYSVEDLHRTETIIAIAIVAFYAWIFKNGTSIIHSAPIVLWAPVSLPVLAILRLSARHRYIDDLENYLKKIERVFYSQLDAFGWERNFASCQQKYPFSYRSVRKLFWLLALAASIAVAANGSRLMPQPVMKSVKASQPDVSQTATNSAH